MAEDRDSDKNCIFWIIKLKISNEALFKIKFLTTETNLRTDSRVNVGKREAEVCKAANKNTS